MAWATALLNFTGLVPVLYVRKISRYRALVCYNCQPAHDESTKALVVKLINTSLSDPLAP